MDVVTISFLVAAGVGAFAAGAHLFGYVPPRYRSMLRNIQAEFASKVGLEVENALNRVAVQQEAKYADGMKDAVKGAEMSIVRSVGVDKAMRREVDAALSEAILGPALPILRQYAPGLAETLEKNPQLVSIIIEHPLFQKYVAPRIQAFLGQQQGHAGVDRSEEEARRAWESR